MSQILKAVYHAKLPACLAVLTENVSYYLTYTLCVEVHLFTDVRHGTFIYDIELDNLSITWT